MAAYLAVVPLNNEVLLVVLQYIYIYNIMFAVFNIIPIPPLDGSQILELFLPPKARMTYFKYQRYGMIAIFVLALTGLLGVIINPVINGIMNLFSAILLPIFNLIWS